MNKVGLSVLLWLSTIYCFTLFAQEYRFEGIVTDILNVPLENSNILAIPLTDGKKIKFSITDEKGRFDIKLKHNERYAIEISFIGFQKITDTLSVTQNFKKNYQLVISDETLDEVIILERIPVKVRQDTITYRVEKFTNGKERKLRDILKKLPGIEIDSDGNAKVNGKPVTKLLVEGKEFFTGDEKLGVNNIPANVIDEVVALDNYNNVAFLKGLSDNNQLALDIKLKKGNEKFVFGEFTAGAGIENRYLIHPTLFYYSPKTSVNIIGDFNNNGQKEFTLQDYIDFEGGIDFTNGGSNYFRLLNDDFSKFLQQNDFTFNSNNFGALSISQDLSKLTRLSAYSIISANILETRVEDNLVYFNGISPDENRVTVQDNKLVFSINKIKLRHQGFNSFDLQYEIFLKTNKAEIDSKINSQTSIVNTRVSTNTRPNNIDFTQNISINKRFNRKYISSLAISHRIVNNKNFNNYNFNQPIFSEQIPFIDDNSGIFNLSQKIRENNNDFNFNYKHYWIFHPYHHIYPEIGIKILNQQYNTVDQQLLEVDTNSFMDNGFNNNIDFNFIDNYYGIAYKGKIGKFTLKPALFYHYYSWNLKQFSENKRLSNKPLLLPNVEADFELKKHKKIRFRYHFTSRFAEASQLANRLRLTSFNQLFIGNESLENELTQRLSLKYNEFSFLSGTFFNLGFSYVKRERAIRNITNIEGIDQINSLFLSTLPENTINTNISYRKNFDVFGFTIGGNINLSDYSRIINLSKQNFNSTLYSYSASISGNFEKAPNFEIGINQSLNSFKSNVAPRNSFSQINPYFNVEYSFLEFFNFKADYTFSYYENKNLKQIDRFQTANTSLLYNEEKSLWTFGVSLTNIFNIKFRSQNSISQFLTSDIRTFIQPRILLFKVGYKI